MKDANEILQTFGSEELRKTIDQAPNEALTGAADEARQALTTQAHPRARRLIFPPDMELSLTKTWVIKNVIAKGENSSWVGQPGSAKSSLLTDMGVHVACKPSWRGYLIKQHLGVVYFALERAQLVTRRIVAHRRRDELPADIPIAVSPGIIDLMNRDCVFQILDTIKAAEDRFGIEVGLTIFDTYNKGIAAGGGDEDKARDQNLVSTNMRRVLERREWLHIAGVGHTGKDPSRGERGSNARLGDVDVLVMFSGDKVKTATVDKANDQPEAKITSFSLEPFELGRDEDGDPFSTVIVSLDETTAAAADTKRQRLTDRQANAFQALADLEVGQNGGINTVTEDEWKEELFQRSILKRDDRNHFARFGEIRNALMVRNLIALRNSIVWTIR